MKVSNNCKKTMNFNINYKLFSLLIITLSFNSFVNSASIYYEKPSSARLAAPSHTPPACTYQNKKYAHGQQVNTPEPCLNCTCRKGVLLCFLRVCPTLIQSNYNENCRTVRESGQCCPVLKCETSTLTTAEASVTTPPIQTTKSLLDVSDVINNNKSLSSTLRSYDKTQSSTTESVENNALNPNDGNSLHYVPEFPIEKSVNNVLESRVTVTQRDSTTTIFQTSPSTRFHESTLLVTSSPTSLLEDDFVNTIEGSCLLNGTVYAEGSAVISTSFCEYCYCIKSKRMCIRPRCHLSILGCLPRYTSEYACCPTSYVCGDEALTTLPMSTTTTTTTTTTESARIFGRKTVCLISGNEYRVGDSIPSDEDCKQCYCSTGGIKKCKKIQCSPEVEGCVPIIPEGHCCPVEYKCNSTQQTQTTESMSNSELYTESSETGKQNNIDLIEVTTDSNIDLNIDSNNEIISQYSTETNSVINSTKLFYEYFSAITANTLNDLMTTEVKTSTEIPNTKTESIVTQTDNTMNGQQIRRNDLLDNKTEDSDSLLNIESIDKTLDQLTTQSNDNSLVMTTNAMNIENNVFIYSEPKTDLSVDKEITVGNDIEDNTQTYMTTMSSDLSSEQTSVKTSVTSDLTSVSTESTTLMDIRSEDSTSPTNTSTESLNSIEDNYKLQSNNDSIYGSVGGFLHGIIHAIDKQLKRRIPAEPRVRNNNTEEVLLSKQFNEPIPPVKPRSENKGSQPSLSSSFFIVDDNEQPYKSGSDGVEIITAKTAFYDFDESPGHSILINLTPSSLKVSSAPNTAPNAHNSHQNNDKNYNILAQNNRATIYGKPPNPYPQHYIHPVNDWRAVGSAQDFPRRPVFEDPKPIDSLYYNTRRQDSDETIDQNVPDFDNKRPRLEFDHQIDANNRMKGLIPFKVNEAVGLPHRKKNGSFLIRLAPNKNSLTPDSTPKTSQQISCFFNGVEYPNGAMIPKSDPCTLCRCFYGRELCQQQKCPAPPEKECVPEKMVGYCCPRYICRITEDMKSQQMPPSVDGQSLPDIPSTPTNRKGPQFPPELLNILNLKNMSIDNSFKETPFPLKNIEDEKEKQIQGMEDLSAVPQNQNLNHFPPLPPEPTPKPFQRISSFNKKQTENRIHFPSDSDSKIGSVVSQPILTDTFTSLMSNSRPSKPINSHPSQYNGANKFRIKPSMTQSIPPQSSPFGSPQKPNLRLPPFLMHSHNTPNTHSNNNVRHKPNIVSNSGSHPENNISVKVETNVTNISIETNDQMIPILSTNDSMNETKVDSNPQTIALTTSTFVSNQPIVTTIKPIIEVIVTNAQPIKTQSTEMPVHLTSSTTTTTSAPKSTSTVGRIESKPTKKKQNPWDLFQVSGCNIYGTMYEIDAQIERLSTSCKKCICSTQGVKCSEIC